jgi:hypothetical protein
VAEEAGPDHDGLSRFVAVVEALRRSIGRDDGMVLVEEGRSLFLCSRIRRERKPRLRRRKRWVTVFQRDCLSRLGLRGSSFRRLRVCVRWEDREVRRVRWNLRRGRNPWDLVRWVRHLRLEVWLVEVLTARETDEVIRRGCLFLQGSPAVDRRRLVFRRQKAVAA